MIKINAGRAALRSQNSRRAFTFIEGIIAIAILTLILFFAYRVFFSQAEMVTQSLEFMQVNDAFRKVMSFMGDDIREATMILEPVPVMPDKVEELVTQPGVVLKIQSSEIDPYISFDSPFGGQISSRHEVIYRLDQVLDENPDAPPTYRLTRISSFEEKPGDKTTQRQVITDNISELVIYRTIRRPFKPANLSSLNDRLVTPLPPHQSGTGNSLVHLRMVVERQRYEGEEEQEVYNIEMTTSFYKRGKEVFINP